jgi:hypothetical protein
MKHTFCFLPLVAILGPPPYIFITVLLLKNEEQKGKIGPVQGWVAMGGERVKEGEYGCISMKKEQ